MALGFLYLSLAISYDSYIKNQKLEKEINKLKSWRTRKSRHDYMEVRVLGEAMIQLGNRIEQNKKSLDRMFTQNTNFQQIWNKKMPSVDLKIHNLEKKTFEVATKQFEDFIKTMEVSKKIETRIDHLATKVNKIKRPEIFVAGEIEIDRHPGQIIPMIPRKIKKQKTFDFKGKHRGWKGIWKISEVEKKEIETAPGTYVEIGLQYGISRSRVGQIKQDYKLRNKNVSKKIS